MTKLESLWEKGKSFSKAAFDETDSVVPMWVGENHKGDVHLPIVTPFEDSASKEKVVDAVKKIFAEKNVVRYFFISEGWMLEGHKDRIDKKYLQGASIAQHEDRREVLSVHAFDKETKESKFGVYYILRPEHGKPVLSEFHDYSDASEHTGCLVDILS